MARIVVLGGGIIGLSTAMLLTRQGHDVGVFEHDGAALPGSPLVAWQDWERRGVAQFRQPHYLHAAARQILDDQLPEVKEALLRAGGIAFNPSTLLPPGISDRQPRADDDRFATVTARRPTIEYAVASAAERLLQVVRGKAIAGLVTRRSAANGIPHIAGVRTLDGEEIAADLVIDATGRRSKLPDWLEAVGARRPIEETEESGFIYYTRFFRAMERGVPAFRAGLLTDYPSFSLLTLPGDADTWSVTVFALASDQALKALRDPVRWTSLVRACPLHAHWLEGEPISGILPMAGVTDRYRRLVVDGAPVATGIVSVGDAWACTNPVGGRGISIGLMHAVGTAEVIQNHMGDPLALALAHDAMTETKVTPWYRDTVAFDRRRTAQIKAAMHGQSAAHEADPRGAFAVAMLYDAELFRASLEIVSLLALPQEVMARPGMAQRIREIAATHTASTPPCPPRKELLRMMA